MGHNWLSGLLLFVYAVLIGLGQDWESDTELDGLSLELSCG